MIVVGIQHIHQISGQILLLHCLAVVSLVKGIQLKSSQRLRIPDPQGVHDAVAVSYDGQIIGNSPHRLIAFLHEAASAVLIASHGNMAAELDDLGIFRSAQLKGISLRQPVVRHLHLKTVLDLLLEHAVAVTDAAAVGGIAKGCQRVQKTCRQTAQASVAQSSIRLLILDDVDIYAQLFQNLLGSLISLQVDQVVSQRPPHKEFHGHVVNHLRIFLLIGLLCSHPVPDDAVLDGQRRRLKNLLRRSLLQSLAVHGHYIVNNASLEQIFIEFVFLFLCP